MTRAEEKAPQTAHFQAVDPRAVFDVAVGILPSAGGTVSCYRPRESPANQDFTDGAGDAVGTLQRLSSTFSPYRDLLTDRGPFKAALNAFVAEDHLLGGRGA